MSKKLYVGNLPYAATEGQLQSLFEGKGQVTSVKLITDMATGRSKGFAFVEMANDDEALQAIEALNGQEMDGRKIVVNEARPQGERPRGGGGGGGGGGFQKRQGFGKRPRW